MAERLEPVKLPPEAFGPLRDYLASEVGWDLKKPCGDCPFTKAAPFHGGVAQSLVMYFDSIDSGKFAHTCHKTDMRPECDGPHTWKGKPQHCVGALLMLLKTGDGKDLQLPLLQAAEQGKIDLAALVEQAKADDNVFTLNELLEFYLKEIKKQVKEG